MSGLTVEAVPLATMTAESAPPLRVDGGPAGTRIVVEFTRIEWAGERLRASLKGAAAADWLTIGPDGTAVLDARFTLETDDGALIYVHGPGRTEAAAFPKGGVVWFVFSFETGAPGYAWLNRCHAVAKGRLRPDGVKLDFEVYELR